METLNDIYFKYKSVIQESFTRKTSNKNSSDIVSKADVFDYEEMLKILIEDYIRKYSEMGTRGFSVSGNLDRNAKGWVDFHQVSCAHISDEQLEKYSNQSPGMRQYVNRELDGSFIIETIMSKSKPKRPVRVKYLSTLRYYVRGGYKNIIHIGVWFAEWTKRNGLNDPYSKEVYFNDLDLELQKMIYEYVKQKLEYEDKFVK